MTVWDFETMPENLVFFDDFAHLINNAHADEGDWEAEETGDDDDLLED